MDFLWPIVSVSLYEGLLYGLLAIGVYLTFRVLSFPDLGVDGTFPLGGAIAAVMMKNSYDPFTATICACLAGAFAGVITGMLNTKMRLSALLSGILMMVALWSINLRIMGRSNIPLLRVTTINDVVHDLTGLKGVWLELFVVICFAAFFFFILNWFLHTELGLALRATGDNEEMMRGIGSDTEKNVILGCAVSNGLVAFTGAVVAQNQGFTDVSMGIGMIMMALASIIIGESIFKPKQIYMILTACFIGTIIYRMFLTVSLRVGMKPGDIKLITALLIICVLGIPFLKKKLRGEWVPPAPRL